jgi:hypothetical protein
MIFAHMTTLFSCDDAAINSFRKKNFITVQHFGFGISGLDASEKLFESDIK